jgi:hypothetical protein
VFDRERASSFWPVLLSLALAGPTAGGCSFLLVDGPPPPEKREYRFYCTRSALYPALDGLGAALSGARLAYVYEMDPAAGREAEIFSRTHLGWNAVLIAVYFVSAIAGGLWVSDCRSAMDAWNINQGAAGAPLPAGQPR